MGERTAWHPAFTAYLRDRAPRWVEVRAEVPVSAEPMRVDDLLAIRPTVPRDPRDEGTGLRGLWRHLREVMLVEFKSRAREFRRGDLLRFVAYGGLWCAEHDLAPSSLSLLLAVPRVNEALRDELAAMGIALVRRDDGYHETRGVHLACVVAEMQVIGEREGDDVLRWFARRDALTLAARRWIRQHVHHGSDDMSTEIDEDLRGFNEYAKELMRKLPLEERLEDLTPEERLAGLAPEEIARAVSEADRLLALPDAALRALPDAYLQTLPDDTRARIRARLAT